MNEEDRSDQQCPEGNPDDNAETNGDGQTIEELLENANAWYRHMQEAQSFSASDISRWAAYAGQDLLALRGRLTDQEFWELASSQFVGGLEEAVECMSEGRELDRILQSNARLEARRKTHVVAIDDNNELLVGSKHSRCEWRVAVLLRHRDYSGSWRNDHSPLFLSPDVARRLVPALQAVAEAIDAARNDREI